MQKEDQEVGRLGPGRARGAQAVALGTWPGSHPLQVDVAVVTKAVTVQHAPALTAPATLVAALNEAQLGASLTFPRQQVLVRMAIGLAGQEQKLEPRVAELGWRPCSHRRSILCHKSNRCPASPARLLQSRRSWVPPPLTLLSLALLLVSLLSYLAGPTGGETVGGWQPGNLRPPRSIWLV